ncbi:hypothetical protein DB313_04560 (plasmid) [Borrelia turcica IST7]|uniref:Lipoprotein n=1 Tax=Borrelia turcica IST7 TaxID=1104446 RepID=A0A386PME6_9SPIR|nr:hypothetical protein [Borrelia turcica]AYE36774.1 hypothetical protein DB313_04560 [Borrelia turcica IST7]
MKKVLFYFLILVLLISCNNSGTGSKGGDVSNNSKDTENNHINPGEPLITETVNPDGSRLILKKTHVGTTIEMNLKQDNTGTVTIKEANGISMSGNIKADGSSDKLISKDKDGNDIEGELRADGIIIRKTIDATTKKPIETRIEHPDGLIQTGRTNANGTHESKIKWPNGITYEEKAGSQKLIFPNGLKFKNNFGNPIIEIKSFEYSQTKVQGNLKFDTIITEMDGTILKGLSALPGKYTVLKSIDTLKGNKKEFSFNHSKKIAIVKVTNSKGETKTDTISFDLFKSTPRQKILSHKHNEKPISHEYNEEPMQAH